MKITKGMTNQIPFQNPEKNLPRSIAMAMVVVTFLYILTNISYLSAMTTEEMINSNAVGFVSTCTQTQ